MTLDELIEERNAIQLLAEPGNAYNKIADHKQAEAFANRIWVELGVANRHIYSVVGGATLYPQMEQEILACFKRVREILEHVKIVREAN